MTSGRPRELSVLAVSRQRQAESLDLLPAPAAPTRLVHLHPHHPPCLRLEAVIKNETAAPNVLAGFSGLIFFGR